MRRHVLALVVLSTIPANAQDHGESCARQCTITDTACVSQMCTPAGPDAVWTATALPDGRTHIAATSLRGRTLAYQCTPDEPGVVAVAGLGGGGPELAFMIDRQIVPAVFTTHDGVHHTPADVGSDILLGLIEGFRAEVTAGQITAVFPLDGSAEAIRSVMEGCGLTS